MCVWSGCSVVACGAELAGSLVEDWAGGTLIESVCVLLVRRAKNEFEQHREVFFYHVGSNIYIYIDPGY